MDRVGDVIARWSARHDEFRRFGAHVDGARLCAEILADLERLASADDEDLLSLEEAAARSGYSADHLGRLVRQGRIPNAGRPHAPRIRAKDLPRKAGALPPPVSGSILNATRAEIAQSVRDRFQEHGHD